MNIGILDTDQLSLDVINQFGSYSDMFRRLLQSLNTLNTFQTYQVTQGHYPNTIDECDAYLITGSKANAYDNTPWIVALRNYITQLDAHHKKLVGICFGHQIIAQALGGLVQNNENGWGVGSMFSEVLNTKPWMNPDPVKNGFSLLVSHQDQVVQLPKQAKRIATNAFCINSSVQIDQHIITFQGHPEFTPEYLRHLMQGRQEIIGQQRYHQALATMDLATDNNVVARWILNFMTKP